MAAGPGHKSVARTSRKCCAHIKKCCASLNVQSFRDKASEPGNRRRTTDGMGVVLKRRRQRRHRDVGTRDTNPKLIQEGPIKIIKIEIGEIKQVGGGESLVSPRDEYPEPDGWLLRHRGVWRPAVWYNWLEALNGWIRSTLVICGGTHQGLAFKNRQTNKAPMVLVLTCPLELAETNTVRAPADLAGLGHVRDVGGVVWRHCRARFERRSGAEEVVGRAAGGGQEKHIWRFCQGVRSSGGAGIVGVASVGDVSHLQCAVHVASGILILTTLAVYTQSAHVGRIRPIGCWHPGPQ
ncbi:hypothetical protein K438DRAFT_1766548 [Mycena galopus ATCC 62051]|nr:hypothetical protein K438DRAFT_1766548 [Mycena galopus ATCC 62051]